MSIQAVSWALEQIAPMAPKFILVCLANYANADGECWPSLDKIALDASCGKRSVQRYLDELEALGLVEKTRTEGSKGRFSTTLYRLPIRPVAKLTTGQIDHESNRPVVSIGHAPMATGGHCIDEPSIEPSITSSSSPEREEPSKNPSKVDWVERLNQAIELAGGSASKANGGTMHYADLRRLCEPAKGEPCDWELDVVPAIMSKAASLKAKGQSIGSWVWVEEGAIRNRDRRLAGLPAPEAQPMRIVGGSSKHESDAERVARIMAKNGWGETVA